MKNLTVILKAVESAFDSTAVAPTRFWELTILGCALSTSAGSDKVDIRKLVIRRMNAAPSMPNSRKCHEVDRLRHEPQIKARDTRGKARDRRGPAPAQPSGKHVAAQIIAHDIKKGWAEVTA